MTDDKFFFQTFGQHGRELITSELAFRILSILSEEQFLPNINGGATLNNTLLDKLVIKVKQQSRFFLSLEIDSLTDNYIFSFFWKKLVPIENFNGRKRVEAGDLCERRNG